MLKANCRAVLQEVENDLINTVSKIVPLHPVDLRRTFALQAFGKYDPHKGNALPVYVVIFNPTKEALRLDGMSLNFETADGKRCYRIDGVKVSGSLAPVKRLVEKSAQKHL